MPDGDGNLGVGPMDGCGFIRSGNRGVADDILDRQERSLSSSSSSLVTERRAFWGGLRAVTHPNLGPLSKRPPKGRDLRIRREQKKLLV